jgi:hypothetical protein
MVFEKAAYWIAVGVLALFVSNNFAARHRGEVRCLANQSLAAVEQVSGHAARLIGMAEMMLGRGETRFVQAHTTLAGAQTRLASVESAIASHEAALARVEAERSRMIAMQQMRATVVCPRQNLRMVIPELPETRTDNTI